MQSAIAETSEFTTHRVTVSCSGSELSFADTAPIRLDQKHILILCFQGIPNDMVPGVTFSGSDDLVSPLGPFQEALQTSDRIILRGNSGLTSTFQCSALLSRNLRGEEPPITSSNQLPVDNEQCSRSAKEIRVRIRQKAGSSPEEVEVEVEPEIVTLFSPDPVVWNFVFEDGLEPRDYAPLLFHAQYPSLPSGIGPFGPFQSLSAAGLFEPLGNGSALGYRLITSGNNDVHRQFHFMVGVRPLRKETSGGIFAVVDPIIDNMGPPNL